VTACPDWEVMSQDEVFTDGFIGESVNPVAWIMPQNTKVLNSYNMNTITTGILHPDGAKMN